MKKNQLIFAALIAAALNLNASEVEEAGAQFLTDLNMEKKS